MGDTEFAGHAVHAPAPGESLYEFAGHAVHAPAPGESLYLPVSHAEHVPPLGPVYPALHVQSSCASLPAFTCAKMRAHTFTNADTHASENLCPCVRVCVCARVRFHILGVSYMDVRAGALAATHNHICRVHDT